MGHQVSISMLAEDEEAFLRFLRRSADVEVYRPFAPTVAELTLRDLSASQPGEWQFFLYNRAFPWARSVGRVSDTAEVISRRGFAYVANFGVAPVLEYDRSLSNAPGAPGRLYWAETFAAPDGLAYDANLFKAWYYEAVLWLTNMVVVLSPTLKVACTYRQRLRQQQMRSNPSFLRTAFGSR